MASHLSSMKSGINFVDIVFLNPSKHVNRPFKLEGKICYFSEMLLNIISDGIHKVKMFDKG